MKKIILCITGSIAAIKSYEIIRKFQDEGFEVQCVVSSGGEKFISRTALESISGYRVLGPDIFSFEYSKNPTEKIKKEIYAHIEITKKIEAIVIAPCSANFLSDFAYGKANDFMQAMLLANTAPVLVAPAMNEKMLKNSAVQENITQIKKRGVHIVHPQNNGMLACGDSGAGKLAEIETIYLHCERMICAEKNENNLAGKNVLINAGGTKECIDPVRYIGNESSGLTGKILAEQCFVLGAKKVVVVAGNISVEYNSDICEVKKVVTGEEMKTEMKKYFLKSDIIIFSAAVADYSPVHYSDKKIKKSDNNILQIELEKSCDIAHFFAQQKKENQIFIGFALETETDEMKLKKIISDKSDKKGFDIVFGNTPKSFASETAEFLVFNKKYKIFTKIIGEKRGMFFDVLSEF